MKWWKAIWAALTAFFATLRGQLDPADTQTQQAQETSEAIDEVPQMSDSDLLDAASDLGLVQRSPRGPGGAKELGNHGDPKTWTYYWGETPGKTNDKPD